MKQQENNIPTCIGIIMDGNRRWAKARNLPLLEGHSKGYTKLKEVLGWANEAGVEHMIVYAFSTENWRRAEEEVSYLMELFRNILASREIEEMKERGMRVKFVGQKEMFSQDFRDGMKKMEEETRGGEKTLWVALSYGGRAEILDAVKKIARKIIKERGTEEILEVTEEDFSRELWTAGMPDPDIIIRTGGEVRLSNFLPWQSVYSELFFTETLWPDFSKEEFSQILDEYAGRERRRGK
ncbi:polyprenyl diphosphate synthase [bacterium]|nr:polyprenyl diphosphate synthase [bacterium]